MNFHKKYEKNRKISKNEILEIGDPVYHLTAKNNNLLKYTPYASPQTSNQENPKNLEISKISKNERRSSLEVNYLNKQKNQKISRIQKIKNSLEPLKLTKDDKSHEESEEKSPPETPLIFNSQIIDPQTNNEKAQKSRSRKRLGSVNDLRGELVSFLVELDERSKKQQH